MVQAGGFRGIVVAAVLALATVGVAQDKHYHDHGKKKDEHGHAKHDHADHGHTAPHGGTLIALGEHFAHLELVLDPAKGKLTAYALDGEVEKSLRLKQPEIEIKITPEAKQTTTTTVRLQASANPLTGETMGSTSEFSGKSEKLKGVKRFSGVIRQLSVMGTEFKDVSFKFPEGNE